jgi:hypothetical protein
MPERWERELRRLRDVDAPAGSVRARVERGPRPTGLPPRRERIVAGVVAALVAIAAAAVMVRTLPSGSRGVGDTSDDLPVFSVRFHDSEVVPEGPDSSYRRVQTSISYGDASDESFTSSTPADAHVEWVGLESLTRFVPGPTAGSPIDFQADGDDPRVLLGRPDDWPNFGRFTPVERVPDAPGEYVILFVADYPEGIARTARLVEVVRPGVLQLVATEGEALDGATAAAYLDGRGSEGFLSTSWFTASDVGEQSHRRVPDFGPDAWLLVPAGSTMTVTSPVTEATAGLFRSYEEFDHLSNDRLPIDLLEGDVALDEPEGRHLLAIDVTWRHGKVGWGQDGTEERVLFFFPIEITDVATIPSPSPAVEPSPSPTPVPPATEAVAIDIRRTPHSVSEDPAATARFGSQEIGICPDGWKLVNADGTTESVDFDCGQTEELRAPPGTPIVTEGDYGSISVSAHAFGEGPEYPPGVVPEAEPGSGVTYTFEVAWPDGSEATFWVHLTVDDSEGAPAEALRIRCGDAGAEILTPVVAAQADGVHIDVENAAGAASLAFALAVSSHGSSFGGTLVDTQRVWPIEPGAFFVECLERRSDTYLGLETARFEVVDPAGYWVDGSLQCAEDDPPREVRAYDGGAADYVDDEAAIRATLRTLRQSDEVRLPFYPEGAGSKDLRYVVVREGRVVAYVFVGLSDAEDPGGAGLTEVIGKACESSGIAAV